MIGPVNTEFLTTYPRSVVIAILYVLSLIFIYSKANQWNWVRHTMDRTARLVALGSTIFFTFIVTLWSSLGRPPLSTMGETRLWYSLFLSVIGIFLYGRYNYKWILCFSNTMALVFVGINLLHPEIHETILMPALQSWWFVPHVVVYMFSYALLGAATLFALYLWCKMRHSDIATLRTPNYRYATTW
jgi:hypothetical protein